MKFGNLLPLDGINLLTAVISRNKLRDIWCYPFPKEPFDYFGASAMDPGVTGNGTSCIAVTRSHVNTERCVVARRDKKTIQKYHFVGPVSVA